MITASLIQKLTALTHQYQDIGVLLSDSDVLANQNRYRELSQEYAHLEPIVACFDRYQADALAYEEAKAMLSASDADWVAMAKEEMSRLEQALTEGAALLQQLLLPKDPNDEKNIFLEIRAGTGGDEAALFAGDLLRMYHRFADSKGWRLHVVSAHESEQGGYKEVSARIEGQQVYSQLKFESGAHRVQRVPATESQGRVHTSACTVAILPEADPQAEIDINPAELRIDTFRASGAGGQHVNKTDSAIRITHLPTGVVVECQEERSQHKNKAKALAHLQAKLTQAEQDKQQDERAAARKQLVGSGDRSERIRTYNFPQGRLTDHRIGLTLYRLEDVMEGALSLVVDPLIKELQAELLAMQSA